MSQGEAPDVEGYRHVLQGALELLDLLSLLFFAGGLISLYSESSIMWGHAFYAISAPMFYDRLLFFAQIFRIPGHMTEVCFRTAREPLLERNYPGESDHCGCEICGNAKTRFLFWVVMCRHVSRRTIRDSWKHRHSYALLNGLG